MSAVAYVSSSVAKKRGCDWRPASEKVHARRMQRGGTFVRTPQQRATHPLMAPAATSLGVAPRAHPARGRVAHRARDRNHAWMASSSPPAPHELRRRSDDELLALVVGARETDNPIAKETARRAWNELVERDVERVLGLVATWRLAGKDVRVAVQDRDDAAQHAFYRLLKMLANFRGGVIPQYRAAMATCVDWACREFCRREMRHEMGLGGSLDAQLVGDDGEGPGRFDSAVAAVSEKLQADHEHGRTVLDAVARAIEGLPNENMKGVLRLTLEGYQSREIGEQLGLSSANVYQLRSRALRRLTSELSEHVDF
jgi:RNA polymerase sigma factor (sigma-70 family)